MEHGGDIYTEGLLKGRKLLDFSSNINPLGVPLSFKENIEKALKDVEKYPDVEYRQLKNSIKEYINFSLNYFYPMTTCSNTPTSSSGSKEQLRPWITISKYQGKSKTPSDAKNSVYIEEEKISSSMEDTNIVLGNGAAEIIDLVISCFKSICIVVPSFIEYEKNAAKWNCQIIHSHLKENMEYDYKDIRQKITKSEALIIGNPNNPNGGVIDKEKFKEILDYCEENHKTIIIDEAFVEFTGKRGCSFLREAQKYKCVFLIRALTKFFALPGIRMGYGLCKNESLIKSIKSKQNPWNINSFAETAAENVFKDKKYIEDSISWIEKERKFMLDELKEIPLFEKVYDSYSNFVLCKMKYEDCQKLYDRCLKEDVLIRRCNNFKKLDSKFIRLAVKDRWRNERILQVLKKISKDVTT
ncbi:pyridoxal phosphate-dependent aminotransferase [Clostridium coskatii]|uniref:Threonine-phosphate decarboxylase n=1 Tax=Clostridium coskatii TaxID=1705578 RepID=A0A162JGF2_9CLOT|nr:histidinol-phosphate transaminase [Clostridium coskatii]OAA94745.1 Threonine-phosphate decarboxylase [Clostridium coskatii]OBR93349.1 threonine-phosphate decarboxylase [Clostridium coskatii]